MLPHRIGKGARRPEKDAAVPVIIAGGDELLGLFLVWFFRKPANAHNSRFQCAAGFDISVARFSAGGPNAEPPDVFARGSQRDAPLNCRDELLFVADDVIRRKDA